MQHGRRGMISTQPAVSIEGPLGAYCCVTLVMSVLTLPIGKLNMTIPPFVKLEYDAAARKAVVSVEDKEVRKQREMWGKH